MRIAVNTCKDTLRSWMRHIDNRQEIEALLLPIASCAEERLALTQAIMAFCTQAPRNRAAVLLSGYEPARLCAGARRLRADRHQAAPSRRRKNSGFNWKKGAEFDEKDPTIREAIDESLCSVRFNAQDERAVLAAIHGRRAQAKSASAA